MKIYDRFVMERVRQNLGIEPNDTSLDDEIMEMPKKEVFSRCCEWEGIVGYSSYFIEWIESIYNIKLGE